MSSSTTKPAWQHADKKKKNDDWIRAYKKASGQKKQTVLPSAVTQNNEWAVRAGWSLTDAATWRNLCEKAKYAGDGAEADGLISLLAETIEMAGHCDTHPIGLIHFARTAHGQKTWDLDTLDYLAAHMLTVDAEKDGAQPPSPEIFTEVGEAPGAPRKKARVRDYEATQPVELDDDDIEDK